MNTQKCFLTVLVVLTVASGGCGSKTAVESASAPPETFAAISSPSGKSVDTASAGSLRGSVLFQGAVPPPKELPVRGNPECAVFHAGGSVLSEDLLSQGGKLQNVFIYVKEGLEGYSFAPPSEPVIMNNEKCLYVPHVTGVQVGQPVTLLNSDPTLHNIHSYAKNSKQWNLGLPFQGMKQTKKFEAAEVMVTLKCDVHPWMTGYIGVLTHPYFSVTGKDGAFELKNLPPGDYLIDAWHEKLGAQSQTITIGPQETKEITFTYN